jgi:hypothetical protein
MVFLFEISLVLLLSKSNTKISYGHVAGKQKQFKAINLTISNFIKFIYFSCKKLNLSKINLKSKGLKILAEIFVFYKKKNSYKKLKKLLQLKGF